MLLEREITNVYFCCFLQGLNGFIMMTTQTGKLLYISDNAAEYLGHSMVSSRDTMKFFLFWLAIILQSHIQFFDIKNFILKYSLHFIGGSEFLI